MRRRIRNLKGSNRYPGYARPADLLNIVNKYRRSQGIPVFKTVDAVRSFVWRNREKIRKHRSHYQIVYYHIDDALDAMADAIYNHSSHSRCHTLESIQNSHLIATDKILNDPNYQPRAATLKTAKCPPNRLHKFVFYKVIIPFYDLEKKRLLYPVDQVKHRAEHHFLWTIRKHLGNDFAERVKATRPKITWCTMSGVQSIYHCPELSHL